jgi:hypothetical protein
MGAREQSGEAHEEGDAPKKRKACTRDALSRVFSLNPKPSTSSRVSNLSTKKGNVLDACAVMTQRSADKIYLYTNRFPIS